MNRMLTLFPLNSRIEDSGHLWLGGCQASALADTFGTPLYILDELTLRTRCQQYHQILAEHYPGQSQVAYASKAYLNLALAQLFAQEGLHLDVVSGGEWYVARQAGFPAAHIHFHGNNKSSAELGLALDGGVGRIVVDNAYELDLLAGLAAERQMCIPIWLRLSPGIDAHTHHYCQTGLPDSKFGFPMATDQAERALLQALDSPHLNPVGLHAHIGSQIVDVAPLIQTTARLVDWAAAMGRAHGFQLRELSPGGGWGVACHQTEAPLSLEPYIEAVCQAAVSGCRRHGLALPTLTLEPGRSLVAAAGVTLYRVGGRKEIPGLRTYVFVDGGMADNIRPALYGARYSALAAEKAHQPATETVTIAGKFCESGDVLVRDIELPSLLPGDLLAIPATGAYCLPLASNYNLAPRPAVVLVNAGQPVVIQKRETYQDLVARDLPLPEID